MNAIEQCFGIEQAERQGVWWEIVQAGVFRVLRIDVSTLLSGIAADRNDYEWCALENISTKFVTDEMINAYEDRIAQIMEHQNG